jgi:hypothetical protein
MHFFMPYYNLPISIISFLNMRTFITEVHNGQKIHDVELIKGDDSYFYLSIDGQSYRIPWAQDLPPRRISRLPAQRHLFVSLRWPSCSFWKAPMYG